MEEGVEAPQSPVITIRLSDSHLMEKRGTDSKMMAASSTDRTWSKVSKFSVWSRVTRSRENVSRHTNQSGTRRTECSDQSVHPTASGNRFMRALTNLLENEDSESDSEQTDETEQFGNQWLRIRVMEADKQTQRVRTEHTVASMLLGQGSAAEGFLFEYVVKNVSSALLLWFLWWIGASVGMLAMADVVPRSLVSTSVLMLPLPFCAFMVCSVDLIWEVMQVFESYMITGLQLYLSYAAVQLFEDSRVIYWFCFTPTMLVASCMDAYPSKYRPFFSRNFFVGVGVALSVWELMLFFGWLVPIHDKSWKAGELEGKTVSSTAQSTGTLLAYCGRHLVSSFFSPDYFVIIMSAVKTRRIHVKAEMEERDGYLIPTGRLVRQTQFQSNRLQLTVEDFDKLEAENGPSRYDSDTLSSDSKKKKNVQAKKPSLHTAAVKVIAARRFKPDELPEDASCRNDDVPDCPSPVSNDSRNKLQATAACECGVPSAPSCLSDPTQFLPRQSEGPRTQFLQPLELPPASGCRGSPSCEELARSVAEDCWDSRAAERGSVAPALPATGAAPSSGIRGALGSRSPLDSAARTKSVEFQVDDQKDTWTDCTRREAAQEQPKVVSNGFFLYEKDEGEEIDSMDAKRKGKSSHEDICRYPPELQVSALEDTDVQDNATESVGDATEFTSGYVRPTPKTFWSCCG